MSAEDGDDCDARSSPDSLAGLSTEKGRKIRKATGSEDAADAAAKEAGSPVSPDTEQDSMPGTAAWESTAKVQGDEPYAHLQGFGATKSDACISGAASRAVDRQETVTVKVERSLSGGLPTVQSAFAEVVVRPGKGDWAAPPYSPFSSEHLQLLSAGGPSQRSMYPDPSPMLKSELHTHSTQGPVSGYDLNTRSTMDAAGNEQSTETQQHHHDKAVITQQQIGTASGEPRGTLTRSSSLSNSSTSSGKRMRSRSCSSSSSFKSSPVRRSSASHRYVPSKSLGQHSQLVATPPHHQPFIGPPTQRLARGACQSNLQSGAPPRQSVAQDHSMGQASAPTGQSIQSQGWLGVQGPLTVEPPQMAQTNLADSCSLGRGPAITGTGGFGHGWASDDLGQHGQSMAWAPAPAQPTGLTSAAGPCNSGLGGGGRSGLGGGAGSGWAPGAGNPWARTKMTRGQKKAKKRRQGAEMKRAWAQVMAERGESIASSVLLPRYIAYQHACEQLRSCVRHFMPCCLEIDYMSYSERLVGMQ